MCCDFRRRSPSCKEVRGFATAKLLLTANLLHPCPSLVCEMGYTRAELCVFPRRICDKLCSGQDA